MAECKCKGSGLQTCTESAQFMKFEAVEYIGKEAYTLCYVCDGKKEELPDNGGYQRLQILAKIEVANQNNQ